MMWLSLWFSLLLGVSADVGFMKVLSPFLYFPARWETTRIFVMVFHRCPLPTMEILGIGWLASDQTRCRGRAEHVAQIRAIKAIKSVMRRATWS